MDEKLNNNFPLDFYSFNLSKFDFLDHESITKDIIKNIEKWIIWNKG